MDTTGMTDAQLAEIRRELRYIAELIETGHATEAMEGARALADQYYAPGTVTQRVYFHRSWYSDREDVRAAMAEWGDSPIGAWRRVLGQKLSAVLPPKSAFAFLASRDTANVKDKIMTKQGQDTTIAALAVEVSLVVPEGQTFEEYLEAQTSRMNGPLDSVHVVEGVPGA